MIIIFKNINDNNFLKAQLKVSNLEYIECSDLNELLDLKKKNKILNDFIYIIHKDYSLNKDFYFDFKAIESIKSNSILGYENIKVDKDDKDDKDDTKLFSIYNRKQDNNNLGMRKITFVKIETELISKLENEEIKNTLDFFYDIQYDLISNKNLCSYTVTMNKLVLSKGDILLKNFTNLKKLLELDNIYTSYLNYINNDLIDDNISTVRLIYNELNKEKLSCFIIYGEYEKIISYIEKLPYNNNKNKMFILSDKKVNVDRINMTVETLPYNKDSINFIVNNIDYNFDVYFLNNEIYLQKILNNLNKNILNGNDNCRIIKISIIYLKFINIESNNLDEYMYNLGRFIYTYINNSLIIDQPNKPTKIDTLKLTDFNKEIIEELYEKKLYDECCFLINFVIKNRLYSNASYIYKTFSLLDKINYHIKPEEVKPLLDLINFDNVDEIFNVCIILKYHKLENIVLEKITDFFKNLIDKKLTNIEVIKMIYILYLFNFLVSEIDIYNDNIFLKFLINNLDTISLDYGLIKNINTQNDEKNIYASVLLFLHNRFELIDSEIVKQKIINKMNDFLGVNLEQMENIPETKLLHTFKEYPTLIWNSIQSLSDCMLSTNDILLKRKNLKILTDTILNNWGFLEDEFKKKNIILNISNFKYSYHGISNGNLFKNIVNVRDNCLKNHFNDTENIFVYKKKEAPKKRIGFISDFLTRNHSVFKDRHQVIKYLSDKEDFEVYLITFNNIMIGTENIYKNTKKIVLGNNSLYNYIKTIRDLNLDKLVFCEIGMDHKVTNLAHFRMANKQYNTWGHSDTSGYKEIDYFVSSKLYELPYEESSKHYTEKLILQNGMCTCYVNPTKKYNLMNTRSFFGLSNYEKIILCPQSLFKIHPDFDLYIFEILFKNPNASIVLLHNERKNKMYERWDKVLKNHPKYFGVLSRVKFVLSQSHQNFCNLMKCADVLIDPYPFGGCNSSLESFSLFKPLVTQPSIRINGRFTYGFYKKMDMDEMIANNMEEYVDITTRLLNDKDFYDNQVNLLKERSDILFEDQETLKEWEELMSE